MKILQVVSTLIIGGAEILCENLSTELVRRGNEVVIACFYDCSSQITERLEHKNIPVRFLGKKSGLDLSMISKLRKIIDEEKPDAIHMHLSHLKYIIPALKGRKIPLVYTLHTLAQLESGRADKLINRYCFKRKLAIPVAISPEIRKTVAEVYGLAEDEIQVIYNGVPVSDIAVKTGYGGTANIINVARFSPPKNHIRMVNSFSKLVKKLPEARLFLAGDGEKLGEVKNEVSRLGLEDKVIFLGTVSNVGEILCNYDVFWLTSNYEGMPMTVIEAMAAGLPVVSTAVGGVPDMIEDGTDGILTGLDETEISEKTAGLLSDLRLQRSIGEAAKKKAGLFSIECTAEKYMSLYCGK